MFSLYIDIIYYSFLSYYYIVATLSSHVVAVTYVAIFVVAKYKNTISIQHDCAKVQKNLIFPLISLIFKCFFTILHVESHIQMIVILH